MRTRADLIVHEEDRPRRGLHHNERTGDHSPYVELADSAGPVLRLFGLTELQALSYLRHLSRECELLIQDIERARAQGET